MRGSRGALPRNVLVGLVLLLASFAIFVGFKEHLFDNFTPQRIEAFLGRFGLFAPLAYIALLAVSIVVSQIPNVPLALAAGMLFGTFRGGLYSLVGGTIGAAACFFIARSLGTGFLRKVFGRVPCFSDRCRDEHLALIVFVSRLIPFLSFDLISYCAGLTNIRPRTFLAATFFGMIPMTFLLTRMGGEILVRPTVALALNAILLAGFLAAPWVVRRFNPFGLREYITFK